MVFSKKNCKKNLFPGYCRVPGGPGCGVWPCVYFMAGWASFCVLGWQWLWRVWADPTEPRGKGAALSFLFEQK